MKRIAWALAVFLLCSGGVMALQPEAEARNQNILSAREAVWRAWFADDETTLCSLVPPDAVAISAREPDWKTRAGIVAGARRFHQSGGKLIQLSFGRTTIQRYGDTAFVYSEYRLETIEKDVRSILHGRATEVFVRRRGKWINPGWHTDSQ